MKVNILMFAALRQEIGEESVELRFERPPSIHQIRDALIQQYPKIQPLLSHSSFAVDEQFASEQTTVTDAATVACIPPVSGG